MKRTQKGEGFPGQRIVVLPQTVVTRAIRHPILRHLLPTDAGYFPKASGHLRDRNAGADQSIFIYCVRGAGWCEMAGRRHDVRAGELLVIPRRASHAYGANETDEWTIYWFHVTGSDALCYQKELGVTVERPVLFLGDDARLLALFEEMLAHIEQGYEPVHLLHASQTLAHMLSTMVCRRRDKWRDDPDLQHKIAQSIDFMKQRLDQPLTLRALAGSANLSSSHYAGSFKTLTGYSPIDYFIRLRMHRACQLLDTTQLSVKAIAVMLGYEDPLYFSRAFKSVNDTPPTEYRRLHKG
jgi:AraC-like DNA-binding protein